MQTRGFWIIAAAAFLCLSSLQAADRSVAPIISRIPREEIESTALATVGYSKRLHALEIEFRDGLIYRYFEVPRITYKQMMAARSKTRFYNHHIRGKFRCVRVRRNAKRSQ